MAHSDSFSASPIVGTPVRNTLGEDIGTVCDVVCEKSHGRLRFALVDLHHESALLVVPWEVVHLHPGERFAQLDVSATELRAAPRLERSEWPCITDPRWDRDVYAYYGCRPYWKESPEDATTPTESRRSFSRRNIVRWAVALGLVIGLGYFISRQGWATTTSQVYGVAEAVRDTTAAVRHTSADAATTAKAKAALALSKRVSGLEVTVDTSNAIATLTGKVPTLEAKELAGQVVADTSGVREVRNLLTVDPSMRPEQERERLSRRVNDLETQTALSEALQDSVDLSGAKVKVRVADGAVTLDGVVTSEAQKVRAEELARTFPGVQRLDSRLR